MSEFIYETYPTGGVFMEERFYTFAELRDLLKAEEIMNRHLQQAMGSVKAVIKKENQS
jgi:hypothetical protein